MDSAENGLAPTKAETSASSRELSEITATDATTAASPAKVEEPVRFRRLIDALRKTTAEYYSSGQGVPVTVQWRTNRPYYFGQGEPQLIVIIKELSGVAALASLDATTVIEAYMADDIEFQGDILSFHSFRNMTTDNHPLSYLWTFIRPLFFGQTKTDRKSISGHYDYPQDFYLRWLDARHRCYSQGVFENDDESLEDAQTRKFEFALEASGAKPGMTLLDIGGGWGSMTEFAGKRGIKVTSLTISDESEAFIKGIIAKNDLKTAQVVNCHLYEFDPGYQFDAIVNLGVTEHLTDYAKSQATYLRLLKPGAKIYLDASACREKYKFHSFIYRYIYPYNCSPLCLHDYFTHLSNSPLMLRGLWDDRHSYYLTAKHWALNLEKHREEIATRWSEELFRKFQIYLWGTADVFKRDIMQAYRWVLEKPL